MDKEARRIDVKQQVWLWCMTLAAAIVLGLRNPLVSSIALVVIGFIWDRLDLTYGQNTLPAKFLPVSGGILGSLVLGLVCLFIYHATTGEYAVWAAIKAEYELRMESTELTAIVWAAIGIALLLLMYVLTAFFITAVLAFTQKAGDDLLGRPYLPYGAVCLLIAWALPCFAYGTNAGLLAMLLSLVFGGFYLLVRKNAVITYFAVFFSLVACFKP